MTRLRKIGEGAVLWFLFFLISAGLGYPGLARYDPRIAVPDAGIYARLAASGPSAVDTHLRFRVLVPFLARGVYEFAKGHTGSWDPLMFAFLVVNSFFVALTAYLLVRVGDAYIASRPVALLGAALLLLNFNVANLQLAGLVDSAEMCLLMAVVATMIFRHWWILPFWGVLGALAKESFVPFSIIMVATWWTTSEERGSKRVAIWISMMAAAEVLTIIALQSCISGHLVWPWKFFSSMHSPSNPAANFLHSLYDRNSWYVLIWLLPLGIAGLKRMPRSWIAASAAATVCAFVLNAYHSTVGGGGGGVGRYIFNVAGPLLSLSAAAFLSDWCLNISTSLAVVNDATRNS